MKPHKEFQIVFWLVRHGETDFNKTRCIQGHKDIELNSTGEEQAKHVASILCQQIQAVIPQASIYPTLYTSDLKRAYNTALIFKEVFRNNLSWELSLCTQQGLRERYFGDLEGKPYGTSHSNLYSATVISKESEEDNSDKEDDKDETNATTDIYTKQGKEPETLEHLQSRVVETLFSIATEFYHSETQNNNIYLFMHGGSIKALICWALGLSFESMKKFRIDNVGISKLDIHFQWSPEDHKLHCIQQHVSQLNWSYHVVG